MKYSPWSVVAALTLLPACTSLAGLDGDYVQGELGAGATGTGATGGEGAAGGVGGQFAGGAGAIGGDGGAGAAGGAGGATGPCDGNPGPTMVDLGEFCIDSTLVTNDQYIEFLDSGTPPQSISGNPSQCSFNTSYAPAVWPAPAGHESHPILNVDWCDAYAYCQWSGKRLCGNIGGGSTDAADRNDPSVSQWYYACSAGGTQAWSFGNSGDGTVCNIEETAVADTTEVGSMAACRSPTAPFDQIFDLTGNAHEWTDECDGTTGPDDHCNTRGGSFDHLLAEGRCDDPSLPTRDTEWSDGSFRCCADKP